MNKIKKFWKGVIALIMIPIISISAWSVYEFTLRNPHHSPNKEISVTPNPDSLWTSIEDDKIDDIEFMRSFLEGETSRAEKTGLGILDIYIQDDNYYLTLENNGYIHEYSYELKQNLV